MASNNDTLKAILSKGPSRTLVGSKQLTLALGHLYIASTTVTDKPLLVWEGESGYARYHVPVQTLHPSIQPGAQKDQNGKSGVSLEALETVDGESDSQAVIERLTVGSKSTTWIRFTKGPLENFIRFEPKGIGIYP
jgi:hypothetical protein